MGREALRIFRAAAWNSEAEIAAFADAAVRDVAPGDLAKWIAILIEPGAAVDPMAGYKRLRAFAAVAERVGDASLFVPYARALRTADPRLREVLVALLPRVNSVSGHIELCRLLGSPDPDHRSAAKHVLAQVGGKAAFDMLVEQVKDPNFAGRIDAIDLMLPKAMHQSGPLLGAILGGGRPNERAHALRVLVESKAFAQHPELAIEVAKQALADTDSRIVAQAVSVLAHHASEEEFAVVTEPLLNDSDALRVRAVVEALRRFPTPRTVATLLKKLREGPNTVRTAVVETAEAIGTDTVLPLLVEALTSIELVVKGAALEAVGRLSDAGRIDPARAILWLLRSRDTNVRRTAVELVNRVGDPRGDLGPKLIRYLRDEDWWVRERTMDALIEIAGPRLTRHLLPYLEDPSAIVRRFVVTALRRIREGAPLAALLEVAAEDDDWWVREEAVAAVGQIADGRVAPNLVALAQAKEDLRRPCIEALVALQAVDALPAIAAFAIDPEADVRAAAIQALGALRGREHIEVVRSSMEDESPLVRKISREVISQWEAHVETSTLRGGAKLDTLLAYVVETDADDLLLFAGRVPYTKKRGQLEPLVGWKALSEAALLRMIEPHVSPVQRRLFEEGKEVDFSYEMRAVGARFRVNLFRQLSGTAAVFRIVKNDALLVILENLGLPPSVATIGELKDGLVLVGGPTGAGKSTTLAALVERVNRTSSRHIVTIEDPIETVHIGDRSLITQREVGSHTASFPAALRAALRQDPDVIVVGELRDAATFQFAVSAAETGHLVLGTMHTVSAETSITRIIHSFPAPQQPQVRAMLAASLRSVITQNLLRRKNGEGRVVASEVMFNNDAIANLIRKGKEFQIPTVMAMSKHLGMHLMDSELARLVREGFVEKDEAFARAVDKGAFEQLVLGEDPHSGRARPPGSVKPVAPRSSQNMPIAPPSSARSVRPPGRT